MHNDELPNNDPDEEQSDASDEVAYAFADLLRSEQVSNAVKTWVDSAAEDKKSRLVAEAEDKKAKLAHARFEMWISAWVGLIVFGVIALLGWKRILSGEVTAGLLGSLIGYWYGRHPGQ